MSHALEPMDAPVASDGSGPVFSCPENTDKNLTSLDALTDAALRVRRGAAPATEYAAAIGEGAQSVAAGNVGPAGHILTEGVDDVLKALERESDYVKDRQEMFEGRTQTPAELAQWQRLFGEVQKESNKRLNAHNVHLFACSPNPLGFGAVFIGFDSERRKYDVTLGIPNGERRNQMAAGREEFVRWMIDAVCSATLDKRREYLARGGMTA